MRPLRTVVLLLGVACTGTPDPPAEPAPALGAEAWIVRVVEAPDAFEAVVQADRSGWVALHANDLSAAWDTFTPGVPRARAAWDLARLYEDLSRTSHRAHRQLAAERTARSALPPESAGHLVAALAAHCAEGAPPTSFDASAHAELQTALAERAPLHDAARSGDLDALAALGDQPLYVETAAGFDRRWFDPCLLDSLAAGWSARLDAELGTNDWQTALGGAGLAGSLFAPWLSESELGEQAGAPGVVGSTMPTLSTLGLSPALPADDDRQAAREAVRTLDGALDRLRRDLGASASPAGAAILADIDPLGRWRQEFLLARARAHLYADRTARADALVQLAHDATERGVGPANKPSVFALAAETRLAGGRVRESLDALQTLNDAYPAVTGLKEVAGDLAVLRSLDRSGDSKEN